MMSQLLRLAIVIAAILAGCASRDSSRRAEPEAGVVPLLQSSMTVDQFIAEVRAGKTIDDLRHKLGIPWMSSMTVHYSLADGTVSAPTNGSHLIINRKSSDEQEIIQQNKSSARAQEQ